MNYYKLIHNHFINYILPRSLNYNFSLGFVLGLLFIMQIVSGLFLVMFYIPNTEGAFNSIAAIMRDVRGGWYVSYFHINGASFIFMMLYCHIGNAIYYAAYNWNSRFVWWSGYLIFLLTIATSFLGYILPWGQMSFWGTTVISQMFSIIPLIGDRIVVFLWGGYQIGTPTLQRVFVLHYLLPFIILAIAVVHLLFMHRVAVNSPQNWNSNYMLHDINNIPLYPYYVSNDTIAFFIFNMVIVTVICFYPEIFGNPVNYIEANPTNTPNHITPEWYFLPLYGLLKLIPHNSAGILSIGDLILSPIYLPFLSKFPVKYNNQLLFYIDHFVYHLVISESDLDEYAFILEFEWTEYWVRNEYEIINEYEVINELIPGRVVRLAEYFFDFVNNLPDWHIDLENEPFFNLICLPLWLFFVSDWYCSILPIAMHHFTNSPAYAALEVCDLEWESQSTGLFSAGEWGWGHVTTGCPAGESFTFYMENSVFLIFLVALINFNSPAFNQRCSRAHYAIFNSIKVRALSSKVFNAYSSQFWLFVANFFILMDLGYWEATDFSYSYGLGFFLLHHTWLMYLPYAVYNN